MNTAMEKKYSKRIEIPCYMFDCNENLRPAAFMDIAQQLAAKGSEQIGLSDQCLAPYGLVWILARMAVEYDSLPRRCDSAIIETWHRGLDSIFSIREYRVLDSTGSVPMIRATSSWVLMDVRTRTVVRPDRLPEEIEFTPQNDETVHCNNEKIIVPKGLSLDGAGLHTVTYSDIDYNGHANNAKYTVWALDALPFEYVSSHRIKRISINFNREAHLGETVSLHHGTISPDTHLIEGRIGETQVFITRLSFHP